MTGKGNMYFFPKGKQRKVILLRNKTIRIRIRIKLLNFYGPNIFSSEYIPLCFC